MAAGGIADDDGDAEPEFDLGIELSIYASVTETSVFIGPEEQGLAEMLIEMKAEPLAADEDAEE